MTLSTMLTQTFRPMFKLGWASLLALILAGFFAVPVSAQTSYEAQVSVVGGADITMAPGARTEVTVEFTNTGSATWYNDGSGYVSIYTFGPKYRHSEFDPGTWLWGDHLKRIREAEVAPGQTATAVFELHAPTETGYYEEVFALASEDTTWVIDGDFTLKINVTDQAPVEDAVASEAPAVSTDGLAAEVAVMSASRVKTQAGRTISFTVAFRNTGTKIWQNAALTSPSLAIASTSGDDFSHPSWQGTQLVYSSGAVAPGELAVLSFAFTAPNTNGEHTAEFQLQASGIDVPDGLVEIPVEVTGGAAQAIDTPVRDEVAGETETVDYIDEPLIRVGVLLVDEETDNQVVITSESQFDLIDLDGKVLATLNAGQEVGAYYDYNKALYYYNVGNGLQTSSKALRFVPKTEGAVMTVTNFDRRETRGASYADNQFRNVLELRHNDYKDRVWLINELGMEHYLRGLTEIPNSWDIETQRAQMVAARSYAYYHYLHETSRAREFMHVICTTSDQVYNGYGREARSPNANQAAADTAGVVVMYQGEVAITPYFARSNGHTKSWADVWSGSVPYAVSVAVPCEQGQSQYGHGVGMSQTGALCMAEDGSDWQEILTHFYTGVELVQRWE